ncbi:unnamed protein product [Amoebophrya sp. A25]|nr:unnamed protein product [Amoebophrya sp. A25]|eukprot:GSA25T00011296001.1
MPFLSKNIFFLSKFELQITCFCMLFISGVSGFVSIFKSGFETKNCTFWSLFAFKLMHLPRGICPCFGRSRVLLVVLRTVCPYAPDICGDSGQHFSTDYPDFRCDPHPDVNVHFAHHRHASDISHQVAPAVGRRRARNAHQGTTRHDSCRRGGCPARWVSAQRRIGWSGKGRNS